MELTKTKFKISQGNKGVGTMDIKDYCDSMYVGVDRDEGAALRHPSSHRPDAQGSPEPKSDPRPMNSISWWVI